HRTGRRIRDDTCSSHPSGHARLAAPLRRLPASSLFIAPDGHRPSPSSFTAGPARRHRHRIWTMARFRLDLRGDAFRRVLGFTFAHWRHQPVRIALILAGVLIATTADVLTPYFAGQLVDAVASGDASDASRWQAALNAFAILAALGATAVVMRQGFFMVIIRLTLRMMTDIAATAFARVQRFSTDCHANSFAGSTVRKVTRGMWALDLLNDTILIALTPSLIMLVGSTLLLGLFWPVMGLVVGVGSLIYVGVTVLLSIGFVAPAASLAN